MSNSKQLELLLHTPTDGRLTTDNEMPWAYEEQSWYNRCIEKNVELSATWCIAIIRKRTIQLWLSRTASRHGSSKMWHLNKWISNISYYWVSINSSNLEEVWSCTYDIIRCQLCPEVRKWHCVCVRWLPETVEWSIWAYPARSQPDREQMGDIGRRICYELIGKESSPVLIWYYRQAQIHGTSYNCKKSRNRFQERMAATAYKIDLTLTDRCTSRLTVRLD